MTKPNLLRAGRLHLKEYLPEVMAAALMYGGIHQVISALKYPLTDLTLKVANAILLKALRDTLPLPDYYGGIPWQYHAKVVAIGFIMVIVGMFVALWVDARHHRQLTS
jgi:hypothetical protein